MSLIIYKSLNEIPIENYHFLLNDNNLAYMTNKPHKRIRNIERLQKAYSKMIDSNLDNDKIQFDFVVSQQKKYYDILLCYYKFYDDQKDMNLLQKCINSITKYCDFMDTNYKNFKIFGTAYDSLKAYYLSIKDNDLFDTIIRLHYNNIQFENKNKFNLFEELPNIEKYYGFQIDIKKTSAARYFKYRNEMIENIKKQESNGR